MAQAMIMLAPGSFQYEVLLGTTHAHKNMHLPGRLFLMVSLTCCTPNFLCICMYAAVE